MKNHTMLSVSLIASLSVFSSCYGHQNPSEPEAAKDVPEMQKPNETAAINVSAEIQTPGAAETANVNPGVQKPGAETARESPEIQKPGEAESIEAAIAYVNRDGRLTIQKSEFIAWGTFNEKQVYWPMKLRLAYKTGGSDTLRHNEYAVKIFRDSDGKLKAAQYYAWRTDFK